MAAPLRDGNGMIGAAAGAIVADATRPDLLGNPP